jgi:hypothetical protein
MNRNDPQKMVSEDTTVPQPILKNDPETLPLGSQEPKVWLQRAQNATTLSEALVCLNQVYALDPQFNQARPISYRAFWRLLEADPFLAYQSETEQLYRVWSSMNLELVVPKSRATVEPYPPTTDKPLAPAYAWLRWTVAGLLLAGLGTLVLAPVTAVRALLIYYRQPLNRADQMRVLVILFLTAVLWLVAIFLTFLFALRLIS